MANNDPDFEIIALTEGSWVDEPEYLSLGIRNIWKKWKG